MPETRETGISQIQFVRCDFGDGEKRCANHDGYSGPSAGCHACQRETDPLPTPDAPQVVVVPTDTACFICAYCGITATHMDPPCPNRNGEQCARKVDAPQVERFKELYETRLADFKREEAAWNAALEKLEAEKARLEGENRRMWDMLTTRTQEAMFAEKELASLRDAVREWKEATDLAARARRSDVSEMSTGKFAEVVTRERNANNALRALVDPQGAKDA